MIHPILGFDPAELVRTAGARHGCTLPDQTQPTKKKVSEETRAYHRNYKRRWREIRRKLGAPV